MTKGTVLFALLAACGPAQPRPASPAPTPSSPPIAEAFGFEAETVAADGWILDGEGYATQIDNAVAAEGAQSLRVDFDRLGSFAVVSREIPTADERIAVSGFVRATNIDAGWVGIWARAEDEGGTIVAADKRELRIFGGALDWRKLSLDLEIPKTAARVVVGALVEGNGTAWIDGFTVEPTPVPPQAIEIRARVVSSSGEPVSDAPV